jgi:hypothetical protein
MNRNFTSIIIFLSLVLLSFFNVNGQNKEKHTQFGKIKLEKIKGSSKNSFFTEKSNKYELLLNAF